jgi:hypothetical protein
MLQGHVLGAVPPDPARITLSPVAAMTLDQLGHDALDQLCAEFLNSLLPIFVL